MREEQLLESKELRDKLCSNYDVLEKVKELLLIPDYECMVIEQIADYYEVGKEAIKTICLRNKDELVDDGMIIKSIKDFGKVQNATFQKERNKLTVSYSNGVNFVVTNRGARVFPRRAILRIGMLLRDSEVAKEVRTQLLNIEEKTSDEVKVQDINEEQRLAMSLGMAIASGDTNAIMVASGEMMAFKNRHIKKLEKDNKGLAGEILEWQDRDKLNAGIRKLAVVVNKSFGEIWNQLYKELQYKHKIYLKSRGGKPYIQHIKEPEWKNVIQTFCAMCEAYGQSPTEMFQKTVPSV